jgi:lipopolysaccharide transport system permease protein
MSRRTGRGHPPGYSRAVTLPAQHRSDPPLELRAPELAAETPAPRVLRVEAGRGWVATLPQLWEYRETLLYLAWREIKVRYRQTFFGATWAIAQPLLLMFVFVAFAGILNLDSEGVPYPIFAFTALIPWTFLSQTVTTGAGSVVKDSSLVSKVYFPRLIMPLATTIALLLDFVVGLFVLALMMVYYGTYPPTPGLLPLLVPFTLLLIATGLGTGTWLSALNVMYRDVRVAVPLLVQIWLFASPIAYSSALVPDRWQLVYALNPVSSVVDGFRWILLGAATAPTLGEVAVSSGVAVLLLVGGVAYFRRAERVFADVI